MMSDISTHFSEKGIYENRELSHVNLSRQAIRIKYKVCGAALQMRAW